MTFAKRFKCVLSLVLAFAMLVPFFSTTAHAESSDLKLIERTGELAAGSEYKEVTYQDGITTTIISNDDITYASQVNDDGAVIVSYSLAGSDTMFESDAMSINEIYNMALQPMSQELSVDSSELDINSVILNNLGKLPTRTVQTASIDSVHSVKTVNGTNAVDDAAVLSALKLAFGSNDYYNRIIDAKFKENNGTYYIVNCYETQTTYRTFSLINTFTAGDAITTIAIWVTDAIKSGNFTIVGVIASLVKSAFYTNIVGGVEKIINTVEGKIEDYECNLTRTITIDNDSSTMYWAGYTRKRTFIAGDNYIPDSSDYYSVKHSDFDDSEALINKGWQNYLSSLV